MYVTNAPECEKCGLPNPCGMAHIPRGLMSDRSISTKGKHIYLLIEGGEEFTLDYLVRMTGVTERTVRRQFQRLVDAGWVVGNIDGWFAVSDQSR